MIALHYINCTLLHIMISIYFSSEKQQTDRAPNRTVEFKCLRFQVTGNISCRGNLFYINQHMNDTS